MSGVYIKGMEMPTACYECCMYQADIYYCSAAEKDIDIPSSDEGRCSFCPLVPVPPHGRLIDADALYEECTPIGWDGKSRSDYVCAITGHQLKNAPTIIPADKGGRE